MPTTTLINRLPGNIPGLLRRWSPCRVAGVTACVLELGTITCAVSVEHPNGSMSRPMPYGPGDLRLDLTDPTGRAHAAWWVRTKIAWPATDAEAELLDEAHDGTDMTPAQIDILARLVLRLAGREVT